MNTVITLVNSVSNCSRWRDFCKGWVATAALTRVLISGSYIEFLIIVRTFESRFMCWEFAGWLTYVATRQLMIFSASFNSIWGWLCDSQQPYFVSVLFSDRFCKIYCSTVFWTFTTISLDLKAGFRCRWKPNGTSNRRCRILYFKNNYLITLFSLFLLIIFFISRSLEILTSLQLQMYFVIQFINYLG